MITEVQVFYVGIVIAAYLCGSIPFGFLIGKMRNVDLRTVGSKNIGATNVYRTVGKGWGILAFACDFFKGLLPTLFVGWFFDIKELNPTCPDCNLIYAPLVAGVMTVIGHMFTCWMKFKGGKGVATGFGMLVALVPWIVLTCFALFVVTVWISHYISLGSILAAALLSVLVWIPMDFINHPGFHNIPLCIVITLVGVASIWKHRTNIKRLCDGNENKIY